MTLFLETKRLYLRHFTEADAANLLELDSDPDVLRYIGPYQLADREAYRQQIQTTYFNYYAQYPGYGFWAVVEKSRDLWIGWCCLRPALDHRFAAEAGYQADDVELGYRLRQSVWGQGYATEAAQALVKKAFGELGVKQIVASALIGNQGSIRVMEKAGLKWQGEFLIPGYDQAAVKYALHREQFDSSMV